MAAYFQDDDSDELAVDLVFRSVLAKDRLASQPTMSRFFNRCDDIYLMQFEQIQQTIRRIIYSLERPEQILLDIASTHFDAYDSQEGNDYNGHYSCYSFHLIMVYDGLTGDFLKAQLRPGSCYTSNGAVSFLYHLLLEFQEEYPDTKLFLRGDSGFTDVLLLEKLESNGCFLCDKSKGEFKAL